MFTVMLRSPISAMDQNYGRSPVAGTSEPLVHLLGGAAIGERSRQHFAIIVP
ncbi:MAG: hypothetical protein WCP55_21540 [Lentisphaerota bacterium]